MFDRFIKEMFSVMASAVMAVSNVAPVYTDVAETTEAAVSVETETTEADDLTYQNIELYPNGEESGEVVVLDGFMPEGAEAEAVDVSDEHDGIAAYDITITADEEEYQPCEEHPILVEISDPAIPDSEGIELWHIRDDGEREQVPDITVEEGRIIFYATGFSVYEIVYDENVVPAEASVVPEIVDSVEGLTNAKAKEGLYIVSYSGNPGYTLTKNGYVTNNVVEKVNNRGVVFEIINYNTINEVNENSTSLKWYVEKVANANTYYIYTKLNGEKKYIKRVTNANTVELVDSGGTKFSIDSNDDEYTGTDHLNEKVKPLKAFHVIDSTNKNKIMQYSNGGRGLRFYSAPDQDYQKPNIRLEFYYASSFLPHYSYDPYSLDGKLYGLMEHTNGNSFGYALMADENSTSAQLYQLNVLDENHDDRVLYVPSGSDITVWSFECESEDRYYLVSGGKYLSSDGSLLSLADDAENATAFKVVPNSDKTVYLKDGDKYINYSEANGFTVTSEPTKLNFVRETEVSSTDNLTYTAKRISVSDGEKAKDGTELIVYTRLWDDVNKKYNFYAIDHNGTLRQVYAYGDKIMWLDDTMNTLLWKFTVYYDEDGEENGYYELQNTFSDLYLAPQLTGDQILSESKIGILLPGRKYEVNGDKINYGEYYSEILAWDYGYKQFVSVDGDADSETVAPAALAMADTFYFATFDSINSGETEAQLHEVETIDNTEYGITMRMTDFDIHPNHTGEGPAFKSEITWDYFGGRSGAAYTGLLSEQLDPVTHTPRVRDSLDSTQNGKDFGEAFSDAVLANHIFINSIHESSGYFEYDSCQNFATLFPKGAENLTQQEDKDGNPLYVDKEGKLTTNSTSGEGENLHYNEPIYDFTVYRELGTCDYDGRNTLKHGQFFPYNTLNVNNVSPKKNLYSVEAKELDDSDPRKYEKLYTVGKNPNYYLGMELEATFVQTPSGLDAWGHDVIFEFTGDDDFWLYVDDELVLDLGGTHSAEYGKVNFRTGKVDNNGKKTTLRQIFKDHYISKGYTEAEAEAEVSEIFEPNGETGDNAGYVFKDYTTHKMKIYYMERGAGASNLHMRFNLSSVTPGNVLFAKTLTGVKPSDDMDYSLVQYPFQIFYKVDEESNWESLTDRLDPNDPASVTVSYQSSTQTVRFADTYTPPSGAKTYENVFFLIPGRNIEINFPDDAMWYYIVECAVNSDIYDVSDPTANNGTQHLNVDQTKVGNIKDLRTNSAQVSQLPTIAFDNKVLDGRIRTLNITKKLYDEHYDTDKSKADNAGSLLKYDPDAPSANDVDNTMFTFRLSFFDESANAWKPADMHRYYLTDPQGYLVKWVPATSSTAKPGDGKYVRYNIGTAEAPEFVQDATALTKAQQQDITIYTSRFGSIADVPAGYTVKVPGLVAGTKFRVEERDYEIPVGYDIIDYECLSAKVNDTDEDASYQVDNSQGFADNSVGKILSSSDAHMNISNRRGIGLEAEKIWSDADFTKAHGDIYFAVYIGDTLVPGTIKLIHSPKTTAKYFFESLQAGKVLSDYRIYEVKVEDPIVVDGKVTSYTSVTRLESGEQLEDVSVTDNDNNTVLDDYTVSYDIGTPKATSYGGAVNVRSDRIKNNRKGGLEIALYQWNTVVDPTSEGFADTPLAGGTFVISRFDGSEYNKIGTYASDSSGNVTVLYGFESGDRFMIEETVSPRGYIGMDKPIYFEVIGSGGNYTLSGSGWQNDNDTDNDTVRTDGKNWAEYTTPDGVMAAKIDLYNKPFTLDVRKIDGTTGVPLEGVEFRLYKDAKILGVMRKAFDPIAGYESLLTDSNGVIPKVDNTLPPLEGKRYYLTEANTLDGYALMQEDVVFTVSDLGIIECQNSELLQRTEEQVGNTMHVTYTISVPNTTASKEYYFDIEKLAFLDRNVHSSDGEQKFVFRVERYVATDETLNTPAECFYVTLNCNEALSSYPYDDVLPATGKYTYNNNRVTARYTPEGGEATAYEFPAAVCRGSRTVKVSQEGIYKVTEVTGWSGTDYDFWSGTNVYKGADATKVIGQRTTALDGSGQPYVAFRVTSSDTAKEGCAKASFTNTETEYAYLSSQAYAENTIKR